MRVIVDSNLFMKNVFEPPLTLHFERSSITLRDLLEKLSDMCVSIEFLLGRDLGNDVRELSVNEKNYFLLQHGLNSPLKEGDKVTMEIYMDPITGG